MPSWLNIGIAPLTPPYVSVAQVEVIGNMSNAWSGASCTEGKIGGAVWL